METSPEDGRGSKRGLSGAALWVPLAGMVVVGGVLLLGWGPLGGWSALTTGLLFLWLGCCAWCCLGAALVLAQAVWGDDARAFDRPIALRSWSTSEFWIVALSGVVAFAVASLLTPCIAGLGHSCGDGLLFRLGIGGVATGLATLVVEVWHRHRASGSGATVTGG